jgi:hypothetical protein
MAWSVRSHVGVLIGSSALPVCSASPLTTAGDAVPFGPAARPLERTAVTLGGAVDSAIDREPGGSVDLLPWPHAPSGYRWSLSAYRA